MKKRRKHRAKSNCPKECPFVSKGGLKLEFAIKHFGCTVEDKITADLGSHLGGFVDCLLHYKAKKVYSVDTCYGTLAWKLRQSSQVIVYERTNALHWEAPEKVSFITIDVGWTRQNHIIPIALGNLLDEGEILSLLKPQYEMKSCQGVLKEKEREKIVEQTLQQLSLNFEEVSKVDSPYIGSGGNIEVWFYLRKPCIAKT